MKYIHKFDDLSELNNYIATDYIEPHVSLTGDDMVDYNIINANGHQYVDLGLPSGTLWSTQSCGSSKWGELTSNNDNNQNTYKYYVANGEEYSKYNSVDNKFELDLEDDQAHVLWGGNWRIPSVEEFNELLLYTNSSYTGSASTYNYTWKLTSKFNGNYITIPLNQYSPYDFSIATRDANIKQGVKGRYCYAYFSTYYLGDTNGATTLRYGCRSNRPIIETKRIPLFGGINILPMSVYSHSNPASKYELRLGDPVDEVPTSYNTNYGLQTHNSAYFNFIELGSRFSSQKTNFTVESGAIDNKSPFASWRLPTVDEWKIIYGTSGNRPGSTVNGVPNKLKAWICIDNTIYGLLLFPDNFYIGGKTLNFDTTYLTRAEFDHYLSQGCRFLGAYGSYKNKYGWGGYGTDVEYALADNDSSISQYQRTVTHVNSSLSSDPIMVDYKQDFYTPVFLVR